MAGFMAKAFSRPWVVWGASITMESSIPSPLKAMP